MSALEERRKSLEDEFFHRETQKELEALRDKLAKQSTKDELRKASGMDDEAVLDKLVEMGISANTMTALSLVPLIKVAWADGEIQDSEREAILHGATGKGIDKGSPALELLNAWLATRPDEHLFEAWSSYIKALLAELTEEQGKVLRNQVTRFAHVVAESAGGFLGFKKVSAEEQQALAWIEATFTSK